MPFSVNCWRSLWREVKQIVDDGICQLNKYICTVKNGKATNSKPRICDSKIKIEIGSSVVGGFLIVTIEEFLRWC